MCHDKSVRNIFSIFLICILLVSQISPASPHADLKNLSEVSTLAAPSIFRSSHPDGHSEELNRALILKKEFLSIAFELYASVFLNRSDTPTIDHLRRVPRRAKESQSLATGLLKFDFSNMRADAKREVLYIPYGDKFEVRVYRIAAFPEGMPLANGQILIERGQGVFYALEVVTAPKTYENSGDKITGAVPVWRDEMARLASLNEARAYRYVSEKEREALNREKVYREVFERGMLPKLRRAREANIRKGASSVLTIGITGSAASGKTTIADNFKKELLKEFPSVRMIFFDDWLLQASDRPIDPDTKKTTEDVFKKFEVGSFVRSMKAFIKGADLLKPVYNQTAKGTLKLTLDDKGVPVILFGPKRNIFIIDSPLGPVLSVRDEGGKVLEEAQKVTQFDIPFAVDKGSAQGEVLLNFIKTRIKISALKDGKRSVRTLDDKGSDAGEMTDPGTGELIVESGVTITKGGYTGRDGVSIDKPWKLKERIAREEGVFIIEGILSLYDDPNLPAAEQLAKLYTTSIFIDADFEIRLERGLARERGRAEALNGRPMALEDAQKYIDLFTQRKEKLEDPFIYATRDMAEYVGTTEKREEGIFSLYRNGLLLSRDFRRAISKTGIDPAQLDEELGRIEEDFILNELRRSTVNGELKFESKIEGGLYDVYFLKNGIIVKVPRSGAGISNIDLLRSKGADVAVPTSFVDLSKLKIKIEGKEPSQVIVQNRVSLFDEMFAGASVREAQGLLDLFFGLQKKMWTLGIVDKSLSLDRYGSMMTNTGRPAVLLRRIGNIGNRADEFDAAGLREIARKIRPDMRDYFTTKTEDLIGFTGKEDFGSAKHWRALPKLYDPILSSSQIDYISSLILEFKTVQLWRLFKKIKLPLGVSDETVWTRLWLDTIAKHTSGAKDAINVFYKGLLADPNIVKDKKPHELRDYILRLVPPLSRQDKAQINKFLVYLCRIPLEMVEVGEADNAAKSTLRIKPQIYDRISPEDRRDLLEVLAAADPQKLKKIIESSEGRIMTSDDENMPDEGSVIYIRLRNRIEINGMSIELLRIEGALPAIEENGHNVKENTGRGPARRVMESYSSGAIIVSPGRPGPSGALLYSEALTEYELMEIFNGSKCETDLSVGVGRYKDLRFKNRPVGYVICAMESGDNRLGFLRYKRDGVEPGGIALMSAPTGLATDISRDLPSVYGKIGFSLRYFHDQGYSHRRLHIGNIGVKTDRNFALGAILRALNSAQDIYNNPPAERAADRFLDVSTVLYDLLKTRKYEDAAKSFLKGYFRELDPDGNEFRALLSSMADGFVKRLEALAEGKGGLDYEELNESSIYFGKIIVELRKIEEAKARSASSDESAREHTATTLTTLCFNGISAKLDNGMTYEIRYNAERLRECPMGPDIINAYVDLLKARASSNSNIKLIPSSEVGLVSISSCKDGRLFGNGTVNVEGRVKDASLLEILNIAFAAANIRLSMPYSDMDNGEKELISFIRAECVSLTGLDPKDERLKDDDILNFIKNLPKSRPVSIDVIEYNRLILEKLQQAA